MSEEKTNIGSKIKHLRELRNLTQSYVAEQLSLSLSGYSKIESGQTDVSFSKIQQIAEILKTDLSTILNFDPKNIFNQCNSNNSVITGNVKTQNIHGNMLEMLLDIKRDIGFVKQQIKSD
jgi:transcriptional regulator with XRE-family HTH domain